MMRSKMIKHIGLVLILGILFSSVSLALAGTRDGAEWDVSCEGFTSNGGGFVMDRDNTGEGREELVITGRDGTGTVIFGPVTVDFFVGGSVYINEGTTFEWDGTPLTNPLTVSVVSPAGNGTQEQVLYTARGTCSGLPDDIAELTAPTSQVNVKNEADITGPQAGYLIVDTYRLNVRSGDGPQYTIVGQVSGGTELSVLGVNQARSWWFVQVNGLRGWVINEEVINRGNLSGTPVVEADGEILPPRFFVYSRSTLYAAPRSTSAMLCEIPGNQEYTITGRNQSATWYQLEATCNGISVDGWINTDRGALRYLGNTPIPVLP